MLNSLLRTFAFVAVFMTVSFAAVADHHVRVDGLDLYLGVVPSTHLSAHPTMLPAGHPIDTRPNAHHVLLAVFDSVSGRRIVDAKIKARVTARGLDDPGKPLHPVEFDHQLTYCNFFEMIPGTTYTIDVSLKRPETPGMTTARFVQKQVSAY